MRRSDVARKCCQTNCNENIKNCPIATSTGSHQVTLQLSIISEKQIIRTDHEGREQSFSQNVNNPCISE